MSKGAVPARGTLASWLADHLRPFPTPHLLFRVWIVGATQRQNVTVRDIATVAPEAHAAEEGKMSRPKCTGGVAILSPRDHRCSSRRAVELNSPPRQRLVLLQRHVSQTWARLSTPPWVKPRLPPTSSSSSTEECPSCAGGVLPKENSSLVHVAHESSETSSACLAADVACSMRHVTRHQDCDVDEARGQARTFSLQNCVPKVFSERLQILADRADRCQIFCR